MESLSSKNEQLVDTLNEVSNVPYGVRKLILKNEQLVDQWTKCQTLQIDENVTDLQIFEMLYVPDSTSQKHPEVAAHLNVVINAALGIWR